MSRFEKFVQFLKENGVTEIYISEDFDRESERPDGMILFVSDVEDIAVDATAIYLDGQEEYADEFNFLALVFSTDSGAPGGLIEANELCRCAI